MEEQYKDVFSSLQSTIRAAAGVASQDISFHRRLDKSLDQNATKQSNRLLNLANLIIQHVNKGEVDDIEVDEVDDDLTDSWPEINTTLNTLTYKIEDCLQQHRKMLKKGDQDDKSDEKDGSSKPDQIKLSDNNKFTGNETVNKHQFDLPKPQNKFRNPVSNKKTLPFKPLLTSKPNSKVSLEESVQLTEPEEESGLERPYYHQPYESEILTSKYPESVFTKREPIPSLPWADTTPVWVDTVEKLNQMIEQISDAPELALDLEHHNYRSYLGITCLLQLSDRKTDYIIDTLALRDDLQPLNKIFTNPNVVKVLHGATMDIIWLQRDLGLYIVSLFDTFYASKSLNLKRNGLAYLLETYANFQTSKKYQLADWRVRPIPAEMLSYAQSDTHFLLNIYDQIKNQILERDLMEPVLESSRKTAAQRFEMPGYDDSHFLRNPFGDLPVKDLARKNHLTKRQMAFLEALYDWRDAKAREVDESPSFVMPVHVMVTLSKEMPEKVTDLIIQAGPHGNRLREHTKELKHVLQVAQKAVKSVENGDEPAGVDQWDSKTMSQSYESILDNYDSYELSYHQAVQAQQSIFDNSVLERVASTEYRKDSSLFLGAAAMQQLDDPETVSYLFPIEHLSEGLPLYSGEASDDLQNAAESDKNSDKQEKKEVEKDVVYIGNSGNTGEIPTVNEALKKDSKSSSSKEGASSSDTIMLPTAAELLGSKINVLTKNERKKLKREKRMLEEKKRQEAEGTLEEDGGDDGNETESKKSGKDSSSKGKKRSAAAEDDTKSSNSKKQKTEDEEEDGEKEAFDYKSAPSVLYADGDGSGRKSKKNKKQKEFNPYSTIEATIQGATKKDIATKYTTNSSVSFKVQKSKKKRS